MFAIYLWKVETHALQKAKLRHLHRTQQRVKVLAVTGNKVRLFLQLSKVMPLGSVTDRYLKLSCLAMTAGCKAAVRLGTLPSVGGECQQGLPVRSEAQQQHGASALLAASGHHAQAGWPGPPGHHKREGQPAGCHPGWAPVWRPATAVSAGLLLPLHLSRVSELAPPVCKI